MSKSISTQTQKKTATSLSKRPVGSKGRSNTSQDKIKTEEQREEKELQAFLSKGTPSPNPIFAIEQLQWAIEEMEAVVLDETESFGERNNAQFKLEGLKKAQNLVGCALCLDVDEVIEAFHQKLSTPDGKSNWLGEQLEHALLYLGNKPLKKSSAPKM